MNIGDDETKEILKGLRMLLKNDHYLLKNDVNERSITHKLGEYYQFIFSDWNVDCEYNRNMGGPKKIEMNVRQLLQRMADVIETDLENNRQKVVDVLRQEDVSKEDITYLKQQLREPELEYDKELDTVYFVLKLRDGGKLKRTVFPDIIIHHRGSKNNHAVLEVKKSTNKIKESRSLDLIKLFTLVNSSDYNYRYGFFIEVPTKEDVDRYSEFKSENLSFDECIKEVLPI